jgi:hypothetical protein
MENINADSLEAVKKRQNRIEDYREMFLAWKKYPVLLTCGYIIGFPNDTKESDPARHRDHQARTADRHALSELLTPLPGSEDHKKMVESRRLDGPGPEQIRPQPPRHADIRA